jgi:hypothetical protein
LLLSLLLPLPLLLPLSVLAVILSEAKDPDAAKLTHYCSNLFNHKLLSALQKASQ